MRPETPGDFAPRLRPRSRPKAAASGGRLPRASFFAPRPPARGWLSVSHFLAEEHKPHQRRLPALSDAPGRENARFREPQQGIPQRGPSDDAFPAIQPDAGRPCFRFQLYQFSHRTVMKMEVTRHTECFPKAWHRAGPQEVSHDGHRARCLVVSDMAAAQEDKPRRREDTITLNRGPGFHWAVFLVGFMFCEPTQPPAEAYSPWCLQDAPNKTTSEVPPGCEDVRYLCVPAGLSTEVSCALTDCLPGGALGSS